MKVYLIERRVEREHCPKHTFQLFDAINLCRRAVLNVGVLLRIALRRRVPGTGLISPEVYFFSYDLSYL
jgi:hypothetical protein